MDDYLFISYSRHDQTFVDDLVRHLREHDLEAWIDRDTDYGDRWVRTVRERVDQCGEMLVVVTPESEESNWVEREVLRAEDRGKNIVPLWVRGDRSFLLGAHQHVDLRAGDLPGPEVIQELVERSRARRRLSSSEPVAASELPAPPPPEDEPPSASEPTAPAASPDEGTAPPPIERTSTLAPEGWYPDPAGRPATERYWTGEAWTANTRPADDRASGAAPRPDWYRDPAGDAGTERFWDGEAWTAHTRSARPKSSGRPPRGWYVDPAGAVDTDRYWDGAAWTELTRPEPADEGT